LGEEVSRVLITGGAGFIGSHLCGSFFVASFASNPGFTLLEHDITRHIHVEGRLDLVLHFASPASPVDYLELPIQTLKVGSLGTHNALGLAKDKRALFLLASTSEVYGDPLKRPQREDYWGNVNPIGPRGVYDEAKRFAEAMTMAYHRSHALETRIARIFNTYGPRMRLKDGRVVPNFISQALSGQDLTVYGQGQQTRSFLYIDDLIRGFHRLLETDHHLPVNLGSSHEMNVLDFAKKVIQLTGSTSSIIFRPLPQDDPQVRQPDITKARELLDWAPTISLDQGLGKTIEYFRRHLGK
jgi:dTDP-glucose 4,6-dehydratase